MTRYALVRTADQVVANIIVWDGTTPYTPPAGTSPVLIHGACGLGWLYDAGTDTFSPPSE